METVNGEDGNKSVLQPISVMMTTHNRTNVACATIDAVVKNLKYKNINWIISDDRSDEGHIEKLLRRFKDNGITDVKVCKTDSDRWGLGAAMNNGLRKAFEYSPIVLTMEDDWILQKELNPSYYIGILSQIKDISAIRLATLINAKSRKLETIKGMCFVYPEDRMDSVFNNQVALRHKRIYDDLGFYSENCSPDESERDMINRFNRFMKAHHNCVLFPEFLKQGTLDDESLYFIHVGESTVGHDHYGVPERFKWIYDDGNQHVIQHDVHKDEYRTVDKHSDNKQEEYPTLPVVIMTHNRTNVAKKTIEGLVLHLKYPK